MCFKIIKGEILSQCRFFLLSGCVQTLGTCINCNRPVLTPTSFPIVTVFVTWNALPSNTVESSSSAMFKRLIDNADFPEFAALY